MYKVSDEYITKLSSGIILDKQLSGTIKLLNGDEIEITNKDLANSSVKIDSKCDNGSDICLGSAYTAKLSMGLFTSIDRYNFNKADGGAVISLQYSLDDQVIPLGVFNVYECTRTGSKITINAYDNMTKLNKSLGSANTNGSAWAVLNWIKLKCGIELANTEDEIKKFINADVVCNISGENFNTYQEVLSELCELMGCFAFMNREGKLELRKFATKSSFLMTPKMRKNTKPADYDVFYTQLIETDINKVKWTTTSGSGDGLTYIMNNKFVTGTNSIKQNIVNNIMNVLEDIYYTPCDLNILYNPMFDLGDMITLKADGVILKEDIDIIITSFIYAFNGSSELSSIGSNRFLISSTNTESSESASSYNNLKYNGTYAATYENIENYTVGNNETIISSIDYGIGTSNKVTLNGACQLDVTTEGTVSITYYMNDEADIFTVNQFLTTGNHILNFSCWFDIPQDLQNMYSNFSIGLKSTDLVGKVNINKVKTYILASSTSDTLWNVNNVFEETIPVINWTNDIYPEGYVKEEKEDE